VNLANRAGRLEALAPDAVLARGYSITEDEETGHVLRAAMVFGIVGLRLYRRTGLVAWTLVFGALVWLIAFSRVYLATHWPTDVAGGLLLGGVGLGICLAYAPRGTLGAQRERDG